MNTKTIQRNLTKAYDHLTKYEALCDEVCASISKMLGFEYDEYGFHVFYQQSDGFVLCWDMHNTPISAIISEYDENGALDEDTLKRLSI